MDDRVLLSLIRQAVVEGRYMVTKHAMEKHGLEGFTYADVKNAILNGSIIARRDNDARVVISGSCSQVASRQEFLGSFLHCVVRWDDVSMMVVITAYRPSIHEWATDRVRLSGQI